MFGLIVITAWAFVLTTAKFSEAVRDTHSDEDRWFTILIYTLTIALLAFIAFTTGQCIVPVVVVPTGQ